MTSQRTALPVPKFTDGTGIVSWIHFGDLHMTTRQEQNGRDFLSLIEEVNGGMADSLNFAYLPGDNAEHGKREEYEVVRESLDRLRVPWFAIVGDHDVHSRSHANFLQYPMPMAFYSFQVGRCRFLALDCFAADDPKAFDLSAEQLGWLRSELALARAANKICVLLLHCYPSELGDSSAALRHLIHNHDVLLVDMGHTHYNEVAQDGRTQYPATRSTGQIEKGSVGLSVTNIDEGIVSWKFKPLGEWPFVMITSPADERLRTHHQAKLSTSPERMKILVKAWSDQKLTGGFASMRDQTVPLVAVSGSSIWEAEFGAHDSHEGGQELTVEMADEAGRGGRDIVRINLGRSIVRMTPARPERDMDNAIGAWPERGILGTQLGPNKNGRRW
jgi:Icc protein